MIRGIYFSGTGNSEHCAIRFLEECGVTEAPVSIEDPSVAQYIEPCDTIVFSYPIYYSNVPLIVRDFIKHNTDIFAGKNIFIIATMGLFSGDGAGCAARLLEKHGAHIIGGLHVTMPDCICDEKVLKKSAAETRELIANANMKLAAAARAYLAGTPPRDGLGFLSHAAGLLGQRFWFQHMTSKYSDKLKIHADACVGCGLCARICPMQNIRLEEGKAVALKRCTLCYRCANNCPRQAITLLGRRVRQQYTFRAYSDDTDTPAQEK